MRGVVLMSPQTIYSESRPESEYLDILGSDLSPKEVLADVDARQWLFNMFVFTVLIAVCWYYAATESLWTSSFALSLVAAVLVTLGFLVSLDRFACLTLSDHECRNCRNESERWRADQ